MTEPSLLIVCVAAFAAVLTLLSVLAGLIRLLTAVFPYVEERDSALVAAITAVAARAHPGTRVTSIRESR
ncbi:MAG: hypothetical protein U5R14_09115 [Gemmatimonadota bacterium]|nr:hypothetical protein [Gemmatimonadota bacterium]